MGSFTTREKGFSLLEVVIAVSLLSIGLLGVAAMVDTVIKMNRMSRNVTVAVHLAQTQMETLKAIPYGSIIDQVENGLGENGIAGSGFFDRTTAVESTSASPAYKQVAVTVSWTDLNARQVVLKSIIAQ